MFKLSMAKKKQTEDLHASSNDLQHLIQLTKGTVENILNWERRAARETVFMVACGESGDLLGGAR